jgi:CHAT domain-containing protein
MPEAGLAFLHHLVPSANIAPTGRQPDDANMYLRRGQLFAQLGDSRAAFADFDRANAAARLIPDQGLREWAGAEIQAARAEALMRSDPEAAIAAADTALRFHQRAHSVVRISELLVIRARSHEARGELTEAAADYEAAISALEHDEDNVAALDARKAAFDQQRAAVTEAVRFAAVTRRDPDAAIWVAERARARVLRNTLGGSAAAALNPTAAHRALPKDVAVVYYATLRDRVLGWLFTSSESINFTVPIDAARLQLTVRRLDRRIAADAVLDDVRDELLALQPLIEPALSDVSPGATLIVVPDVGLARIPFAALPDEHGAPLIVTHPIMFAPSFTTFVLASERLSGFVPDGIVALGDGHDPKATGLPRLPQADFEATEVSRLYPHGTAYIGGQATVRNFLAARQPVIHFAGHTIANPEFPQLSRLLFATDPRDDRSGVLLASDVSAHRFAKTAVVVLASCQSAAGTFIPGEGFDSVARMFLDAGVPAVIASLWPVDDSQSSPFVEFHKHLRPTRDVARALRAAQMKELGDDPGRHPLRQWAGFAAFGGVNATWPGKDGSNDER